MRLSDIFYFNMNDRIVGVWIIAVVACIVGIVALANDKEDEELASAVVQGQVPRSGSYGNQNAVGLSSPPRGGVGGGREGSLHSFDLNTASPDELMELGFSEREIRSVMNYRSKGGVYRRVEQMSKISGMTKGEYDRLAPYFYVSDEFRPASDFVTVPQRRRSYSSGYSKYPTANARSNTSSSSYNTSGSNTPSASSSPVSQRPQYENNKLKPGEKVPINSSDTTALKRIPGVGSYYASQIVKYREKLGGFVSVQQLDDLQNIPADVQDYLSFDPVPLRKINVNTLSINRMIMHPYLTFYQAKAIKDFIQKNGPLKSLSQLSLNKNFTEEDIIRLEPYVEY